VLHESYRNKPRSAWRFVILSVVLLFVHINGFWNVFWSVRFALVGGFDENFVMVEHRLRQCTVRGFQLQVL